jgi:benzaldehyde dehydrogenase (NAD)
MALMDEEVWRGRIYSGGGVAGSGGDAPVIEPATGAELGRTGLAGPSDVASAARLAAAAQPAWAATPHTERSAILRRAADLWLAQAPDIEWWGIRESGKIAPAMAFETHVATTEIYQAAALPSHASGELLPSETPRLSFAERVPVGVVGVIAPFNFPQILAVRSVAPALALGHAVVLKPHPRTAVCGGVALARVLEEAGLPGGLRHVLPGGADVGEAVVTEPLVRLVSFTGSTAAGRRVGEVAARHLKRVHPELGGNSAPIVLADVDLDRAVPAGAWGSFLHQGQICMTTGRHLVHEAVYDDYVAALADKASHLPVGNPATGQAALGPIIDERQRDKIHALVTESAGTGARFGGTANLDAFTDTRWVTIRGDIAPYPF